MMKSKYYDYIFYATLATIVIILLFVANTLSISYKESLNVFDNISLLRVITFLPLEIFGFNDIVLRLPFITFYTLSSLLMYMFTKDYFKYEIDRLINIVIFMLLPGVLSASLLVNTSIIVLFCTLLYLYNYKINQKHNYILLATFIFIDNSFAIFYVGLFLYSFDKNDRKLMLISGILFLLSMYIYGFDTRGRPSSFFINLFGSYASIFSPLLFLYFFYAMYRTGIKGTKSIYWYISITALIFSLVVSIRQRINVEDFAPYVVIALPMMLKLFLHTYRVRLPRFRTIHKNIAIGTIVILIINVFAILHNKPFYALLQNPKKHFAYNYHIAKEIATLLKEDNINEIFSTNERLMKRLRFYGIKSGTKYFLTFEKQTRDSKKYKIVYSNREVLKFYISK